VRDRFFPRRKRLHGVESSTVHHPHQKVHLGLQYRRLERFDLGVGQVVDEHLTCRLLVIWEPVSENPCLSGLSIDLALSPCFVPVTRVPETRAEIVAIIGGMLSAPINDARFAMLPFILLWWAIAWSSRYMPFPIKNPLVRVPVQLIYGFGLMALTSGQLIVFRKLAGINGELFKNDNLSFAIFLIGPLVSIGLVFNSVTVRRKRQQSVECKSGENTSHLRAGY
jgi:hypothetical protein